MRRKREPSTQAPVVPEALLDQAMRALGGERPRKPAPCVVCGGECAANATDGLCWVCRRLKLSAWRDSDSQMPVQE